MSDAAPKPRPGDTAFVKKLMARFCAPRLTAPASKWVEENLRLNEPKIKGAFSFAGREYLREFVDSFGPETPELAAATDFAFCAGTGSGKTVAMVAGLCYRIANDPMRALVVKPTSHGPAGARSFVKTRLMPTIKATEPIRKHIPTGVDRYDVTTAQIQMNGCVLDFTGSNSVSQLGENRCDEVVQDEMDKYPEQAEDDREASAEILADERTKSVSNSKRHKSSTPTLAIKGIWAHFMKGDRRRYYVPCPHCQMSVVLAWSKQFTVFEIKGNEAFVKWDDSARIKDGWNLEKVVRTAHFECPHCQGRILDRHKPTMNRLGKFVPTAKGAPGHISWHLPSLYAITADCSVGQLAKKFLMAKQSLDGVKGFINSDLAEPDVQQSVSVNKTGIASGHIEVTGEWLKILSTDYHAQAPYFVSVVRAWNGSSKTHGIEYREYNNWYEMDELQAKHKIIKEAVIIDAGYNQAEVTRECCDIQMPTRCELAQAVQDQAPECCGWQPSKSFGGSRFYKVTDEDGRSFWLPFKKDRFIDPFTGTDLASSMRVPLLEFLENHFEDMLQNIVDKKTGLEWTISPEMDTDTYHKHMAAKVKRPWKKNPKDLRWQTIGGRDDHIRLAEVLNLVLACRLELISFESLNVLESKK